MSWQGVLCPPAGSRFRPPKDEPAMDQNISIGLVIDGSDGFIRPVEVELGRRYHVSRFTPSYVSLPVVGAWANHVLLNLQLLQFMRAHDLVFFEWAAGLLVKATHLRKACPIVTRLHSGELLETAPAVDWDRVDATITVTDYMRRRLLDVADVAPRMLCVVQNGIDLEKLRPGPRTFQYRIGMACRVTTIKRVYEAVLCLYELRRQGYPFTLDVAGPLEDERERRYPLALQSLVERLGLTEHVSLRGHIADMAAWYQDIDVFLSNSFWESGQNALKEAMASGCYCLSHWWGGAEEVLPATHLFFTDSDLREKLLAYAALTEEEKAEAQAEMRSIAEAKFDVRQMTQQIVELVDDVLRGIRQ